MENAHEALLKIFQDMKDIEVPMPEDWDAYMREIMRTAEEGN